MYTVFWEPAAFDHAQALISGNPALKPGFAYSLETLAIELGDRADEWGESRSGGLRLGSAGILSVLVRVNSDERTARVVDVSLERRARRE